MKRTQDAMPGSPGGGVWEWGGWEWGWGIGMEDRGGGWGMHLLPLPQTPPGTFLQLNGTKETSEHSGQILLEKKLANAAQPPLPIP